MDGPHGTIESPSRMINNTVIYEADMSCKWRIIAPTDHVVTLSIEYFEMEGGEDCQYDSLTISERLLNKSLSVISKLCGNLTNSSLVTFSSKELLLHFISDGKVQHRGFRINYSTTDYQENDCNGDIQELKVEKGQITSPLIPGSQVYHNNAHCLWRITVNESQIIMIKVLEISLEAHETCHYDSLRLYDGPDKLSDNLMVTICTAELSQYQFRSTGHQMLVEFQTDNTGQYQGFSLFFQAEYTTEEHTTPLDSTPAVTTRPTVKELFTSVVTSHKMLSIMTSSAKYMTSTDATSENTNPSSTQIIENSSKISTHSTTLVNSPTVPDTNNGYCNSDIPLVLQEAQGTFSSPTDDTGNYLPNSTCQWQIQNSQPGTIELEFVSFHIEFSRGCKFDSVIIYDVDASGQLSMVGGPLCGFYSQPISIQSTQRSLLVVMVSDEIIQRSGFKANYNFMPPK